MAIADGVKKRLWFAYFVALLCWTINGYVLLFSWLNEGTLFARVMGGHPYVSDFVNLYDGGILGLQGKSVKIYDYNVQAELMKKTLAPIVPELPFYLQAPPIFFVCCIPLAFLSLAGAWELFCAVALAALIWAIFELCKSRPDFSTTFRRAFAVISVLASFPAWIALRLGNNGVLLVPGLTIFFSLLKSKKYFAAGLASALLMVKVQYLPTVMIIGFVLGRWRYLAGAAIAGLLVCLLSVLVVGADNVVDWVRVLLHAETTQKFSGVEPEMMQNIRGMIVAITNNTDTSFGRITAGLAFIASVFAVGFMWFKSYPNLEKRTAWAFEICAALSTLSMIIFSVHTHTQDYVCMAIAGIFLYSSCLEPGETVMDIRKQRLRNVLLIYPFLSWLFFIGKQLFFFLPVQPFVTFAIALAIYSINIWFINPKPKT